MIGLKKKKRLMLIIMADKASLFFWRKIKDATYVFQPRE